MPKSDTERPKRKRETLEYIQAMLRELKIMAEAEDHGMLAYLLEMAYIEVGDSISNTGPVRLKKLAAR